MSTRKITPQDAQRGRPPLPPDVVKVVTIRARVTKAQADKYESLGGAEWWRKVIDRTPDPKIKK